MKKLFGFLLLLITMNLSAKTYYVDAVDGRDNFSGLTTSLAWQTINQVNASMSLFAAGDFILFKSGQTFYGRLNITKSGLVGSPITFGSYGGGQASISGLSNVTGWSEISPNIYQSSAVPGTNFINLLLINNTPKEIGRWPNASAPNNGYQVYPTVNSNSSITDPNFSTQKPVGLNGGRWHGRKLHDQISSDSISSISGNIINFVPLNGYAPRAGYSYIITHNLATLDVQDEWYISSAARRVHIWSTTTPSNVQVSTIDTLIDVKGSDYITISNLDIVGANQCGIAIGGSNTGQAINTSVLNCTIRNSGREAIYTTFCTGFNISGTSIDYAQNNGIVLDNNGSRSINTSIHDNSFTNIGTYVTMMWMSYSGATGGNAITLQGDHSEIYNNRFEHLGHCAVAFYFDNVHVNYNYINDYCRNLGDAGAINVFDINGVTANPEIIDLDRSMNYNLITNAGTGEHFGTTEANDEVVGAYVDDKANNVDIIGNHIINGGSYGVYVHNGTKIRIRDNTIYNVKGDFKFSSQLGGIFGFVEDDHAIKTTGQLPIREITLNANIAFQPNASYFMEVIRSYTNDIGSMFTSRDSNVYARPLAPTTPMFTSWYRVFPATTDNKLGGTNGATYTLLKSTYPSFDPHTRLMAASTSTTGALVNDSFTDSAIFLFPGKSRKIVGLLAETTVANEYKVPPLSSVIYLENGASANAAPVVNAGIDQTITLPTSTTTLSATATDDVSVSSTLWTKTSGPAGGIITSPNSATTTITSLQAGIYTFTNTATDGLGLTGADAVQVTVQAANLPPTANAGTDQIIVLPTNTTTLVGTASDPEGGSLTIVWTKIGGPSGGTIATPNALTTNITALQQGNYQYQLTVTDNVGATKTSTVQVRVDPAPNVAPTVDAGPDKNITLPTSTTSVTATANDPEGGAMTYSWTFVAGPKSVTFGSATALTTTINAMTLAGTYVVAFTATDAAGAVSTPDNVSINVAPVPNTAPIANAGPDRVVTLPTTTTTLDGTGSSDAQSSITYSWVKIAGPTGGTLSSSTVASPSVSALQQGDYDFQLTVTDLGGLSASDVVHVRVNPAIIINTPPTANAGFDITITAPTSSTTLLGSGSDVDGPVTFQWFKLSGTGGTIVNPTFSSTALVGLTPGVYLYRLLVTGNIADTASDVVQVTVLQAPNVLPTATASANPNQFKLPTNSTTLIGTGTDSDGFITDTLWTKISGPSTYTITNPTRGTTTLTNLVVGLYTFEVSMTDDRGGVKKASTTVQVDSADNILPVVNAGPNVGITQPTNSVSFVGTATDADGIFSTTWTKISGPSATILSPNNLSTAVISMNAVGDYVFELAAVDNRGGRSTSLVTASVAAANQAPLADAGGPRTIVLPRDTVTLFGSASDLDGAPPTVLWTKLSGPSATITSGTSLSPLITVTTAGFYNFQILVTDDDGTQTSSVMTLTVENAPVHIGPKVFAGFPKKVFLPSTLVLIGQATAGDSPIASYSWTQIGTTPSIATITTPGSISTTVTGLVEGTYTFQLFITDTFGATAASTVEVKVYPLGSNDKYLIHGYLLKP